LHLYILKIQLNTLRVLRFQINFPSQQFSHNKRVLSLVIFSLPIISTVLIITLQIYNFLHYPPNKNTLFCKLFSKRSKQFYLLSKVRSEKIYLFLNRFVYYCFNCSEAPILFYIHIFLSIYKKIMYLSGNL